MRMKAQQKINEQKLIKQEIGQQSPNLMKKPIGQVKNTTIKPDKLVNKKQQTVQTAKQRAYHINLMGCKSFPNILLANSYIKLQDKKGEGFKDIVSKFQRSLGKNKCGSVCQFTDKKRQTRNLLNTEEPAQRKIKFKRRNTFNIKTEGDAFGANSDDSYTGNAELVQENITLKQKLLQYQQKISELTTRIDKLNPKISQERIKMLQKSLEEAERKLNEKQKFVQQLQNKIQISEDEKKQLSQKLEDLIQEQEMFKGSVCNGFNLEMEQDNSGIGMDMLSTAEYIESLTDLEDELHNKKTQIFDLNKVIQQLKIKQHFSELRHEQNLRRVNQEWNIKYKRLMHIYKTLKANNANTDSNKRMKKQPTKTEFIDQQKEDLFNLSLSTDRSQLLYNN